MKLLVIDDHPIVLEAVAALLAGARPNTIVITATDTQTAFQLLEAHPDLDAVLLDLRLPGGNGHAAIARFGQLQPTLPVIVLSSSDDAADVRKALALGALGYVPKSASPHALMAAIDLVLDGEIYVPPFMLEAPAAGEAVEETASVPAGPLTERQIEVLAMLSRGLPNKAIAAKLNISEKTVKIHISAIFRALNVINRTQAAAVGCERGLI